MITLLGIGFLGGLITGISPCILPVLPVIVAGGAAEATTASRWRPYAIIGGLVVSFTVITLLGGSLLSLLGLPQDFLYDAGIALLAVLGLGLMVPGVGEWLERPFARLGARHQPGSGSGLVLGASLGLVFVPCAGPVLTAISVVAAAHRVGPTILLVTLAYALGTAVPLLAFALLAQRTTRGWTALRTHMPVVRRVAGAVLAVTALAIAFNWTRPLQTSVPGYASALEGHIEGTTAATRQLNALKGARANRFVTGQTVAAGALPMLGRAPDFTGITQWLNTPGGRPLTLAGLRGKVVLVDFWTYSCINCQRTLPHVEAWYRAYEHRGLVVVGVHTPEFPFEHVVSNVRAAAAQYGVDYPVAVDDNYDTWNAYNNEYWPAEYLIDQNGEVRHTDFGEGDYGQTERDIRLLVGAGGARALPPATEVADRTPTAELTPETYLGYARQDLTSYQGSPVIDSLATRYQLASSVPVDGRSFGGTWTVNQWEATADTAGSTIELNFMADDVYLVLGGTGTVGVSVNGVHQRSIAVAGVPDLYTLVSSPHYSSGLLRLTFSKGVQAFDFTFG
jgi:cytochrome c biogenesis protein CcdA/thiol-disulfide isomerase/thioredoxin